MKRLTMSLFGAFSVAVLLQAVVLAQTTGSITGTVVDANGAAVPNATVVVKGGGGQEFTVVSNDDGFYRVPSVASGVYSVTTTAPNFKRLVVEDVKVDVGLPSTVNVTLQAGEVSETVVVTGGGEVLQTETATVGTTITGRQITETPIASRDALDLVALLPGTNSVGAPRRSSINGLPKGALSITIDGVDVQDNLLRSSDGFFTYVRPRVDAIEEVTVSSAVPGSESSGDGAVSIRFVTRRGTNDYNGSAFWQHRDESLNANYWYSNRDGQRDENGKAYRQKLRLNQYGARFGGPIPFLKFGDGGGDWLDSGRDKRFFFVNYEELRQPESQLRTRTVLTTAAQSGNFSYFGTIPAAGLPTGCTATTGNQMLCTRNLLTIAANANTANPLPGRLTTVDPTIASILASIRSAVSTEGSLALSTASPNRETYSFQPSGNQVRKFLALRLDFNLTKNHSLEFVTNQQEFVPSKDFLNAQDERFPGFPFYTQGSQRDSYAVALRSNFGKNVVNEARYAVSQGESSFAPGIGPADFAYSRGYVLDISLAGITTPYSRNSFSTRSSPTYDFTNTTTWIKGAHTISFGGQYKRIKLTDTVQNPIVPTIGFGIAAEETTLSNTFTGGASGTLPGAPAAALTEARNLYATLIGHIVSVSDTARLVADGTYQLGALQTRLDKQDTFGLFAQDSWRVRNGLTVNFGLRWQPQGSYVIMSENYARMSSFADLYGVSGLGNIFRPGTLSGTFPTVVGMEIGEEAYPTDYQNWAPSVGVVWSPSSSGFFSKILGGEGKSVFRAGYSRAFVREGTALIGSIFTANPGGSISVVRSVGNGNLTVNTNLRDVNNPNLVPPAIPTGPSYPLDLRTLPSLQSTNVFDPSIETGYVDSFSFGYQREIDRDSVIEFRYVGNRGNKLFRQHNLNELNTIENGLVNEYRLARQNLEANIQAQRCQGNLQDTNPAGANFVANCRYNFAYFGPGTGTNPLPISLSYIGGSNGLPVAGHTATLTPGALGSPGTVSVSAAALNPASYLNALFRNTAFASNLSRNAPALITFGSNLEGAAQRRNNALAAGLPSNFFFVNPTSATAGSFVVDNSSRSWYDGGVIEYRRRLSQGLRVAASYTFAKAQSDAFQSNSDNFANYTHREGGQDLVKGVAVFDIRHAFKVDSTYDLPFGRGRAFFSGANGLVNALIGGFSINPVIRWQSGSPIQIGNVQLVGMTPKELTKMVKVRKNATTVVGSPLPVVAWLPDDVILNSIRAFAIDPLSSTGYGVLGPPQGKFIAPAGYGDCISRYSGECGYANLVIYGPSFFKFDASILKRVNIGERRSIELRATFLDALNMPNFRVGGWNSDVVTSGCCGNAFGQLGSGSAYQDISTTNDPGGRLIDLMFRINF